MIGSIISAALAIGGAIYGGVKASQAAKKQEDALKKREKENEDWYNRRYNEDPTTRADAQRILTMTSEKIKQRNKALAGRSAVMGGDDAAVAVEKERNAQAMADAISNIYALGEARKDDIEDKYMRRKDEIENAHINMEQQKAQNIASAVSGGVSGASNAISNIDF